MIVPNIKGKKTRIGDEKSVKKENNVNKKNWKQMLDWHNVGKSTHFAPQIVFFA
jgi:hypothetical protein